MNQETYQEKVAKLFKDSNPVTLSRIFKRDLELITQSAESLEERVSNIKKTLFYKDGYRSSGEEESISLTEKEINTLHTCLGLASEGLEIFHAFAKGVLNKDDIDFVNLKEEMGDIKFYHTALENIMGLDEDVVRWGNIKKLEKRFGGDEFDSERVLNRDKDNENSHYN